ncbi:MAG: AbrB/MazE/SpoVT family DNA-binding domain-containing protein [Mesorhizobium sp.]|jgi:antitoxin PrlF
MGARATLTSKGQITIPKEVRVRFNLGPGDTVEFVEEGGRTWLRPRTGRISDLFGMLGPPPGGERLTIEDMDDAVKQAVADDDERIRRQWHEGSR